MLEHGHNIFLVLASLAIALMSGFTGLSLTQGASKMGILRRKLVVSMAAVALGSGIWSMHFVAMLGMTLPVPFHYDALVTMISALVAILLTGVALLLVHFGARTPLRITSAGVCVAIGVLTMHYIGMSGIQAVEPVYSVGGILTAIIAGLALCIASFWIGYGKRAHRNILVGTFVFGSAVVAVHFVAMAGTDFVEVAGPERSGLWLSNEVLAFGVTLSSFLISGSFLLVGVTFAAQWNAVPTPGPDVAPEPVTDQAAVVKLPFEKNGRIHFVPDDQVAAIRAEGRYTVMYHGSERLFCPWSISEVEKRLINRDFVRSHRSYLVNTKHVASFERKKDNGVCYFGKDSALEMAPVSRSYLKKLRESLGV